MYLNQKALWAPVMTSSAQNTYGDVINAPNTKQINVRRQEHVEEIRTEDGAVHKTNFIYYTHEDVKIQDRLDGHLVIDSYDMRSLIGRRRLRRLKTI